MALKRHHTASDRCCSILRLDAYANLRHWTMEGLRPNAIQGDRIFLRIEQQQKVEGGNSIMTVCAGPQGEALATTSSPTAENTGKPVPLYLH